MTVPVVGVRGLSFRYPKATRDAIPSVDLEVGRGQTLTVLGPSGSGKSTLLYILGLFLRPTSGEIHLHGLDVSTLTDRDRSRLRAHQIGFVFQDASLHAAWSVEQNVAEGAIWAGSSHSQAMASARKLLAYYGLSDVAGHLPTEISGGQAQRAALCRALIRQPTLILADEPTGNLDADSGRAVLGGLARAAEDGAAIVLVTHARGLSQAGDVTLQLA